MKNLKAIYICLLFVCFAITPLYAQLTPFQDTNGKYGYKDASGNVVIAPKYEAAMPFVDGRSVFKLDDKFGFVDDAGIEFFYEYAFVVNENFMLVGILINEVWKLGLQNHFGQEVISLGYNFIDKFDETFYGVGIVENGEPKWGILDVGAGKEVIPPKYSYINKNKLDEKFYMVYFKVNGVSKIGLLDSRTWQETVSPKYSNLEIFDEKFYKAEVIEDNRSRKYGLVWRASGIEVIPPIYRDIDHFFPHDNRLLGSREEGFYTIKREDKYGVLSESGQVIIPAIYDRPIYSMAYKLIPVYLNGKAGYVDQTGQVVVPLVYHGVSPVREGGYGRIALNGKYGLIDDTGTVIIQPQYDSLGDGYNDGLFSVSLNGKTGYMDNTGKTVIPFMFDEGRQFSEGLAAVKINEKFGYTDRKGDVVIPFMFDEGNRFSEGLAAVKISGKYGYTDKKGEMVIPAIYSSVTSFRGGLASVQLDNNGFTFTIDKLGRRVLF